MNERSMFVFHENVMNIFIIEMPFAIFPCLLVSALAQEGFFSDVGIYGSFEHFAYAGPQCHCPDPDDDWGRGDASYSASKPADDVVQ